MAGIQVILLLAVAIIGIYFLTRYRRKGIDLLVLSAMIGLAIFFILFPDASNVIAKQLGVGRGADMIFYLSIVTFWFVILKMFNRIRRLEQMLTGLIRDSALKDAEKISGSTIHRNK